MNKITYKLIILLFSIGLVHIPKESYAQLKEKKQAPKFDSDTNYVTSFPGYLNARIYFSEKFTNLRISKRNGRSPLRYNSNTTLNFGVGATYGGFTLNLAYGFSALNEDEGKGETQYLDLQSHIYGRKYVIDLYGQFYTGLYLENTKKYAPEYPENFYTRPDIRVRLIGLSAKRVMNDDRFSYSAVFVQNRMQKKSAGSLLFGVKAIAAFYEADSNLIPPFASDIDYGNTINKLVKSRSIQSGATVGYAYTAIFFKHFFLTGTLNLGLSLGPVKNIDIDENELREWQLNQTFSARVAFWL